MNTVSCTHYPDSFHHHLSPACPLPPFPTPFYSGHHHTVVCLLGCCFCLFPSPFSPSSPTPLPSDSCQSILCISESVSVVFAYFVHTDSPVRLPLPGWKSPDSHPVYKCWLLSNAPPGSVSLLVPFANCGFGKRGPVNPGERKPG